METIHFKGGSETDNLLNMILNMYWGNINSRKAPDIEGKYFESLKLLNFLKARGMENQDRYDKLTLVINNIHTLFKNPKIIEMIQSKSISKGDFFRKYQEELFGDHKRKYSMADLYNQGLIARESGNHESKKISYKEFTSKTENEYRDSEGNIIRITPLGDLTFEEFNGVRSFVTKYRVQREFEKNYFVDDIVFSSIDINRMDDEEYRQSVLEELLSENNIKLSGCEGYIGEIIKDVKQDEDDLSFSEKRSSDGYRYRLNNNYSLSYDAATVSAVIDYENMNKDKTYTNNKDNNRRDSEKADYDR